MRASFFRASLISGAFAASLAFGQDVNYYLAYGDVAFASKNGSAVGTELKACNDPFGLSTIKLRLMAKRVGGTGDTFATGGVMFAFDRALKSASNYTNAAAFGAAQTEKVINSWSAVWGRNLPGKTSTGELTAVDILPSGAWAYSGSAGDGTTQRPIGMWSEFGFAPGTSLYLELNKPVMLVEFTLGLDDSRLFSQPGFCWGDAENQTGLNIFGTASASSRFTYLGSSTGSAGQRTPKKYGLFTSIPEPASMLTLGGALVAFARWRRK